ncbi:DivIVA domain-containing protein [Amycolatopsis balhimycina DSM 5908]|uniref:Cell wall synthesis protein Wag31 n=1 Tax=Amycolatopsis balhimycina DSM 5908 TaxID=1081091 RepID=A0A428WG22_AMYBA|nr:DivIVA domain-containing protein [Amycolatopsis balhimycina]RSM42039.1 DivIVA domain-containing protein [Amycolatopsis balhimycina DSM 5908]
MTPEEARSVAFGKPRIGRRGYNEDEVDAFLDLVAEALAGRNILTPDDIHYVEFTIMPVGMRSYDQAQVDLFLDEAEAALVELRTPPPPAVADEPQRPPSTRKWFGRG